MIHEQLLQRVAAQQLADLRHDARRGALVRAMRRTMHRRTSSDA